MKFYKKKWIPFLVLQLGLTNFTGCFADSSTASGAMEDVSYRNDFNLRDVEADVLILNGEGLSDVDARSIASILEKHSKTYRMVNSAELNSMSLDDLTRFRMIAVPGGYGGQFSSSLNPETRERVRLAVVERGVNYVGFCAGAFLAVGPISRGAPGPDYGFSIIPAPKLLDYFYPYKDGNDDVAASLPIAFADGTQRQILFWGGPALFEVQGGVIARYSDGTPAIVQMKSGNAFVTIAGPHPEGSEEWKTTAGVTDPDGDDFDIAWKLFESTLQRVSLKTYSLN